MTECIIFTTVVFKVFFYLMYLMFWNQTDLQLLTFLWAVGYNLYTTEDHSFNNRIWWCM